jgi:rubredoxin
MSTWPKPTWEPLWLRCGPCGHEWDDWQPCHVPILTWTAHVQALRCPKCRARRKLFMRMTPLTEATTQAGTGV